MSYIIHSKCVSSFRDGTAARHTFLLLYSSRKPGDKVGTCVITYLVAHFIGRNFNENLSVRRFMSSLS